MKVSFLKIISTRITAKFHCIITCDFWQQNCLSLCNKLINQLMGRNLIWQRIISQDNLHPLQLFPDPFYNRKRHFLKLLWGELPLCFTDLFPQIFLIHKPLTHLIGADALHRQPLLPFFPLLKQLVSVERPHHYGTDGATL